jgi:hypothetical protein
MTDKINNFTDLEIAANQLQDAIAFAYNETVPSTCGGTTGIHPGGIKTSR